jgi:putative addiction module component (TIGR02574 family)
MTADLQAILDQALTLPKRDRVELVDELLESLDSAEEVEAAWTAEIRSRLAELRSGKADVVDWADARAEIHRSRQ